MNPDLEAIIVEYLIKYTDKNSIIKLQNALENNGISFEKDIHVSYTNEKEEDKNKKIANRIKKITNKMGKSSGKNNEEFEYYKNGNNIKTEEHMLKIKWGKNDEVMIFFWCLIANNKFIKYKDIMISVKFFSKEIKNFISNHRSGLAFLLFPEKGNIINLLPDNNLYTRNSVRVFIFNYSSFRL
ncbi:hypothetical protein [endosymbiont GvMRE of Glomus versiforme]|uniref:hypothetical protein n=1 Tax=endosymbiont GvMRE of Glomus versiforme TaxID=2039283 RepID=UPI000ED3A663|nr:hypothetical protein [endosymbiont GvMRE of Glomus versiforme]RHZ35601.1 hypothetical protein GvMRE_IIg304 [endosymbiont GvMRE of Glomus versiforme]